VDTHTLSRRAFGTVSLGVGFAVAAGPVAASAILTDANGIEAGMVFVNVVLADGAELPFGGIKRSGSGRELGRFGADEFVNKKMIRIG